MKKLNLTSRIKFGITSFLLLILLASCKTVPTGLQPVDALELMDANSSFYIAIPKEADTELIERIITGFYADASESDAKMIASRVNKVYCGLNRSRQDTEVQASIDANVPLKLLPKVLNEKNGWIVSDYTPKGSDSKFKLYSNNIEMTFPSENLICVGRDIEGMLTRYDTLSKITRNASDEIISELDEQLISYLKGAESEIRFFANKPQSFLTILTGAQLDLKLIDVKGSFKTDPKHPSQYLLTLDFQFKNGLFLKSGKALLVLAFGLTNPQEEIIGENQLIINDIRIDKKQLYKLLSL